MMLFYGMALSLCLTADALSAALTAPETASQINTSLTREVASAGDRLELEQADDATWLRRVYLDLVGQLPSAQETTAYLQDSSDDRRERLIEQLLDDPRCGLNWARYWRDVILYRRTDERALLAANSLTQYLSDQFNQGVSWQQIARQLVIAEGELSEDGRTGLIASQWGQVPETAAEVSRVLMGVQIQCAECHDHKTDRWKRTQFHELAAFFPRIGVRAVYGEDGKRRDFEVFAKDNAKPRAKKPNQNAKAGRRFEHYMPDLDDPAAPGTLMQPVFFLTGQQLEPGLSDSERREAIAKWITAEENPWFARAFVNRIWAELIGEGFYEPIDDLGPDRECQAPETLDLLTAQFVANNYDLKWLLRTITATEAYGRASRPRSAGGKHFEATCPQPLRADQVFDNLVAVLGLDEDRSARAKRGGAVQQLTRGQGTPRGVFLSKFGFDPSEPRDEHAASIDQALLLMNAPALARALSARASRAQPGGTLLSNLLEEPDDVVIEQLYLRLLARKPKPSELETCRDYLLEVSDRDEAFEDILWSLVNSTEFLYRD